MFRSTLRTSSNSLRTAVVARSATRSVGRRWASTGSHAPLGSDKPWAIASLVVFGATAAALTLGGGSEKAVHHGTTHQKEKSQKGLDKNTLPEAATAADDATATQSSDDAKVKESLERAEKADAPQQAESAEASGKAPTQETETKSSGKEGSSEVADPQEGLKTDEPPKSDVLDSIHQSEAICDPKAAMAIEGEGNPHKKGEATPASEDKKSSSEDSEEGAEPSQKEILESIHQAERVALPTAALADEESK